MINCDQYSEPTASDDGWDEELREGKDGGKISAKEYCIQHAQKTEKEGW